MRRKRPRYEPEGLPTLEVGDVFVLVSYIYNNKFMLSL